MFHAPEKQHEWLKQLVGEWTMESECMMGPDQPPLKSTGTEVMQMFGDLWVVGDGTMQMPDGGKMGSRMTIGFDSDRKKFVGTWIGSPMTHMFIYEGELDASSRVLTLNTTGPSAMEPGKSASYQDIIEIHDERTRTLTSRMKLDDGSWTQFMKATYRRKS